MFNKYTIIFLIFLSGILLLAVAQENNFDIGSGYGDHSILIADNEFDDPPPPDMYEGPSQNGKFKRDKNSRRPDRKITPELETRILNALEKHFPDFYTKAVSLKQNNPEVYKRLVGKLRRHIRRSREPREEKIDLISMIFDEAEVDVLVLKYKSLNSQSEKSDLKRIIRERMSIGFDKREKIQKKVINRIEKNIIEKKKAREERLKNKEKIIDKHLENLLK